MEKGKSSRLLFTAISFAMLMDNLENCSVNLKWNCFLNKRIINRESCYSICLVSLFLYFCNCFYLRTGTDLLLFLE